MNHNSQVYTFLRLVFICTHLFSIFNIQLNQDLDDHFISVKIDSTVTANFEDN